MSTLNSQLPMANSQGPEPKAQSYGELTAHAQAVIADALATATAPCITSSFQAEDMVLDRWVAQAAAAQDRALKALKESGNALNGVESVVAHGRSWGAAIDRLDWERDEVLVLGSSEAGVIERIFLGSNASKIVRHSPVPVVVGRACAQRCSDTGRLLPAARPPGPGSRGVMCTLLPGGNLTPHGDPIPGVLGQVDVPGPGAETARARPDRRTGRLSPRPGTP